MKYSGGDSEEYRFLGCGAVQSVRKIQIFHENMYISIPGK